MVCEVNWVVEESERELALRLRPLREHWEARGPGLLGHLRGTLPWLKAKPEVSVHLVTPRTGGGRIVALTEIEFEAVLANPFPMLPEVVRLGWLIGSLGLQDVDFNSTSIPQAALIPAAILAAEYVELATLDQPTVECALLNWGAFDVSAKQLYGWWESVRDEVHTLDGWRAAIDRF